MSGNRGIRFYFRHYSLHFTISIYINHPVILEYERNQGKTLTSDEMVSLGKFSDPYHNDMERIAYLLGKWGIQDKNIRIYFISFLP